MKRAVLVLGVLIVGGVASCGKSEPSTASAGSTASPSSSAPGGGQAGASSGTPATPEQAAQQSLQQMSQAQGKQGPVTLVDYEVLKGLLPELGGWERSGVKGQQVSMGISVSSAEAHYRKGDASIKLELVDTSFSQIVLAPFMMFARTGYEERSDEGYKKGITLAGYPGFESWEKNNKDAEVHLLVGDRFLVNADANGVESSEPARALVEAVNLSKLAGLK